VLVSNRVANTISKIDYTRGAVVAEFPAPSGPDCMDVSADGTLIMVGSRWAGKLTLIDIAQRRVVNQVKVGKLAARRVDAGPRQPRVRRPRCNGDMLLG
jgi:DNA-binding beta-propeller fold protein YncE